MNLGIKNSKFDLVCQWNDDVLLANDWNEVINSIDDIHDFYIFNWKYGKRDDIKSPNWLKGEDNKSGWCLCDRYSEGGEIVVNYGIYRKKIFKKVGMYNTQYNYYYADGDMSFRAKSFGFNNKSMRNIKVCSIETAKKAIHFSEDYNIYKRNLNMYRNKKLPEGINFLL